MSQTAQEILATLDTLVAEQRTIGTKLDALFAKLDALAAKPAAAVARPAGALADAADLDGQYGDPQVRKDPPRWSGASYAGKHYSECPPEYLETLAGLLDWQAGKDMEKGDEQSVKYAGYKRKDAARARGWAKRLLDGWKKASAFDSLPTGGGGADDLPFAQLDGRVP